MLLCCQSAITLSVIYAECRKQAYHDECHLAERPYAEYRGTYSARSQMV
jgi:hypothetical protein